MKSDPFLGVLALLNVAPSAFAVGDGDIVPRHRIKNLAALRKEVLKWRDTYNPSLSDNDVDDLVGWLNRNFYKLEK
jgi:hypothetical protein